MNLPLIPIKNSVLFPNVGMPLVVGRPSSLAAVSATQSAEDKSLIIATQRNAENEDPGLADLYPIGVRALLQRVHRHQNQAQIVVQGIERVTIESLFKKDPLVLVEATPRPVQKDDDSEIVEALQAELIQRIGEIQTVMGLQDFSLVELVRQINEPLAQVYLMASVLNLGVERGQAILEADSPLAAMRLMHAFLLHEERILKLRKKISEKAATEASKEQREYILRQQLRAIQQELGEEKPEEAEINLLRQRLKEAALPEVPQKEAEAQLQRLSRLNSMSPDYSVIRSHLELILELPWRKKTADNLDLERARRILDEDHFDLKKVKERILEHLAVLKLNPQAKAPILCFVGPPGTGKTSLGQSIARALERKFERMSLGGLHDEAELRGHRRTYVGSMPGRILQAIRRAGANNPLLMLDEIDKLGRDFRGDPAAALMEILDPAQNFSFRDNYLDLPFDLSAVFFITTANALDTVPAPLLDRMEVLHLSGYTEEEKIEIAKRYLIPRQWTQTGLKADQLRIDPEALQRVIRRYTREAGLRELERSLGSLARKIAMRFAEGRTEPVSVKAGDLAELLGPEKFLQEDARKQLKAGVSAGLAWTEAGGEVLYIESRLLPGQKGVTITGHLGEVMKESVQTALSYVRPILEKRKTGKERLDNAGIHVHVPSGAVPKDGPSAGVAIAVAAASLYSNLPVRSDTAMTGEITLTGLVLPVGGIKEKVLAARRSDLRRVILPKANATDLSELPEALRKEMEFVFVEEMDQVLAAAIPSLKLPSQLLSPIPPNVRPKKLPKGSKSLPTRP